MKQWQQYTAGQQTASAEGDYICDLESLGLILVSGPEAGEFLQNQLSNDITLIDQGRIQMSSLSTPKGRMLGIFRVIQVSNGYLLLTPRSTLQSLLEHLFKYIVQSQVSLADASNYFARFGIQTDQSQVLDHELMPRASNTAFQNDSVISVQLEPVAGQQRFVFLCLSADEAIDLWQHFAGYLQIAEFESWHLSEIKAGIPAIYPETAGQWVLQMANLGALDGVSFKKGCYPGQEIVARMQYLGKLKQRMYLGQLETSQLPRPGDPLVAQGKLSADGSGMVVDAEFDTRGLCHCLYIARIAKAESGDLRLLQQPGIPIRNVDLPYTIEN